MSSTPRDQTSTASDRPVAVIIGAGPGVARSVAARFHARGFALALMARTEGSLNAVETALPGVAAQVECYQVDASDPDALRGALDRAVSDLGVPTVLVYNAAVIRADSLGELSVQDHHHSWSVNVLGAITAIEHLAGPMSARGGTAIITGGMPQPDARYVSLSLGKAAVRTATQMLAATYASQNLHVATVTIGGPVAPGTAWDPDDIADHYIRLVDQEPEEWETFVCHGC